MNLLVLASHSPRRRELIQYLDRPYRTCSVDLDEVVRVGETPEQVVMALAFEKAERAANSCETTEVVIGSDTVVAVDGTIFGKPEDTEDAKRMLRQLSGTCHEVYTGLALWHGHTRLKLVDYTVSKVWFRPLDEETIDWYVATGEPMDKAGAYAIQGYGSKLIDFIEGDYFSIVGLSVSRLDQLLSQYGL